MAPSQHGGLGWSALGNAKVGVGDQAAGRWMLTHWADRSGPWPGAAAKPTWTLAAAVARWAGQLARC